APRREPETRGFRRVHRQERGRHGRRGPTATPRPRGAGRHAARRGRLRDRPADAERRHAHSRGVPDGPRRDRGQDPRADHRRRRLRDQAVQPGGGRRQDPRGAPPHRRGRPAAPAQADVRRHRAGRGEPRGVARRSPDRAVADRVQAAALLHDESRPGAVQAADPRPRVGLRLPGRGRHRRVLCLRAPPQDRQSQPPAHPHPARCRVRPATAAGRVAVMAGRLPLRVKLMTSMLALLGIGMSFIGVVSVSVLHGYLMDRVDSQVGLVSVRVQKRLVNDAERRERGWPTADKPLLTESDTIVLIREPSGKLTPTQSERDVDLKPGPRLEDSPGPGTYTAPAVSGDGEWRVRETTTPYGTFVVATDLTEVNEITRRLVLIELLGGGGIVLILAVVGVTLVRRSLRPLVEIERTAGTIAAGELGRRVPDGDPRTEVGRLAAALNGMLAQIESAFAARSASEEAARRSEDRMRQFVTDASHELRTPLTSIRGFAEYARQNPGADPAELMQRVENAAGRMSLLVDDLLLLAQVDQQRPLKMRPVDMLALAADAVQEARILAPDRQID